ncbi:glycoside hydrolase family 28 protein [Melioribacter sp. OK-6-Me]|uniref:glycoside hydrolase family 28 protein n=1 Tax=unclassified Melioribacter TaxID=2627329 RepID=UPI003ED8DEEE
MKRRDAIIKTVGAIALTTISPSLSPFIFASKGGKGKEYNVLKFGATGDGKTLDTKAIQEAIDRAYASGGNAKVIIPEGYKFLIGTIVLQSGIEFFIDQGAELIISTNQSDYKNSTVFYAEGAEGLTISGYGNIEGRATEFMSHYEEENEWWIPKEWRPKMFILKECKNLQLKDFSFSKAPEWGVHMLGCENVLVDGIRVRNYLDVPNSDGIDPDHCRKVEIKNCDIVCGDDAIVVKATRQEKDYGASSDIRVYDCILETQDSGLKIGTETTSNINNVVFENCKIKSSCRGINIQLRDNGIVSDIAFRNIEFISRYHSDPWWGRGEAISFTAIPRNPDTNSGIIRNILVKNVFGKAENSIRINGTKESIIENVTLENVSVKFERWTKYKGGLFDNRPTKVYEPIEYRDNPAISIKYSKNVSIVNSSVKWGENLPEYFSNAIKVENSENVRIKSFYGNSANPDQYDDILFL